MPGIHGGSRWRESHTGAEQPSTSFGTCQRFSITSIGAERAVVRRFEPTARDADGDTAGELVATFPDPLTARRAYAVLEAWHRSCGERLSRHRHPHVGELQDVAAGDRAGWYLLSYGPVPGRPRARFLDAQGMVAQGSRIAMVSLRVARDHDDDAPGEDVMVTALTRAAGKLG